MVVLSVSRATLHREPVAVGINRVIRVSTARNTMRNISRLGKRLISKRRIAISKSLLRSTKPAIDAMLELVRPENEADAVERIQS